MNIAMKACFLGLVGLLAVAKMYAQDSVTIRLDEDFLSKINHHYAQTTLFIDKKVKAYRNENFVVHVDNRLIFIKCSFVDNILFNRILFEEDVIFSPFAKNEAFFDFVFSNSVFKKNLVVLNSTFQKVFDCTSDSMKGDLRIVRCKFQNPVKCFNDFVYGETNFLNTSFKYEAFFNGSIFDSTVRFDSCFFNSAISLEQTQFSNSLIFNRLRYSDSMRFSFLNTVLPDTIDFSNNQKLNNEVDLSVANFKDTSRYDSVIDGYRAGRRHYINLYKADIPKFHIDYSHFRLLLIDPETQKPLPSDEAKSVYEAVLKNFRDRGQMDSYEALDIEYNDYKWSKRGWLSGFYIIPKCWNNYGYSKSRVFSWTALFLLLFTLITYRLYRVLVSDEVYKIDNVPSYYEIQTDTKKKRRRLWYSFVYTSTVFFLFWLKVDKLKFDRWGYLIYLMIVYTTGIVCLAYMANLILQK